jgi:hypothetical protein
MNVDLIDLDNTIAVNDVTAMDTIDAAPTPVPQYADRDGDAYLYVAAVSEEQQKRGQASGDVVMFKYLGRSGGLFRLEDASGAVSECSNPCRVIKTVHPGGYVSRTGFSPSSIFGSAFSDAFNGFLEVTAPPRTYEPPSLPAEPISPPVETMVPDENQMANAPDETGEF